VSDKSGNGVRRTCNFVVKTKGLHYERRLEGKCEAESTTFFTFRSSVALTTKATIK
jgi:hypothetical protein